MAKRVNPIVLKNDEYTSDARIRIIINEAPEIKCLLVVEIKLLQ